MKQIMIVKPGSIKEKDKDNLSKNGIIVVEHPNPDTVRIVTETEGINGNVLLMSALKAIHSIGGIATKSEFFEALHDRVYRPTKKP